MENLRYLRIAEISKYDLDYANESLSFAKEKLAQLNNIKYEGNIPRELFLEIHLIADDIYLLNKRIGELLDKQLDDYHANMPDDWNKQQACNRLRGLVG